MKKHLCLLLSLFLLLPPALARNKKVTFEAKAAQDLGAVGVLGFRQATSRSRYFRLRLEKEIYKPDFVILSVENRIPNFIFKDLKTELRFLFQEIDKTSSPMSLETGVKIFVSVKATFDPQRPTRNVLAKISGVDNNLRNEYVIIGAHMDHLGLNPLGEVMNGANDNASGTAVVMEIARVMKLNQIKPKRTVIFALWAGEEQGLLGSRYYADHPLYPIEKTVAYINMDMVGHGNGHVPFRGVYYAPHIWEIIKEKLPPEILGYIRPGRGGPGGSDHTPFLAKGVPGYAIMTEGYHFKYHQSL
ncbi:MAG: M28 family metallopeptidase [Candidatus Aminicenantales bacterium]